MPFASDGWPGISDSQVYAEELALARLADELGFMSAAAWGTPDQILSTLEKRRDLIGPFEYTTAFRYGGIPFEEAKASMELFGSEVLPVLQSWR
jgi:hypothetical protein